MKSSTVRDAIKSALSKVTINSCPEVLQRIQTARGYKNIEAKIIRMMVQENMSPSEVIPHIENEYALM